MFDKGGPDAEANGSLFLGLGTASAFGRSAICWMATAAVLGSPSSVEVTSSVTAESDLFAPAAATEGGGEVRASWELEEEREEGRNKGGANSVGRRFCKSASARYARQ